MSTLPTSESALPNLSYLLLPGLDFLFMCALPEQGFTLEQAQTLMRRVKADREQGMAVTGAEHAATSARMAERAEAHAAGIAAWRARAELEVTKE